MASYKYTTTINNQTIAFNPTQDSFSFDISTLNAAPGFVVQRGSDLLFSYGGKTFTLMGTTLAQLSATNLTFANGSQLLTGDKLATTLSDSSANSLRGTDYDDLLYGLDGNDTLMGGLGNNVLNGGAGHDVLYGSINHDILIGGIGIDTANYAFATAGVSVDLNLISAQYTVNAGFDTLTEIENLTGSDFGDTLIGNGLSNNFIGGAGNDYLMGNGGNDTLDGGLGNDTVEGGTGSDVYIIDNSTDVINETGTLATEIDKVLSSVSWTLTDSLEALTLTGNMAIDGIGNSLGNKIIGNEANNLLNGNAGLDTLDGGLGNDTYIIDTLGDNVIETSNLLTEIDTVESSISWTLGYNVENLTLVGNGKINGSGNGLANLITGNAANNILNGAAGNDTLVGGLGKDVYNVDNLNDTIIETSTNFTEIDTVQASVTWTLGDNLEKLTLVGAARINGMGNALNNTLVGNLGMNSLNGGTGNDILDGGIGNDTLTGGEGADIFNFTKSGGVDVITDFNIADDTIQIKGSVFPSLNMIGLLSVDSFKAGAGMVAASDVDDYVIYDSSTGALYYDAEGNSGEAAVKIALLGADLALTYADFVVI